MSIAPYEVGVSPFDAIKQTDGTREWWSARDLMPLLGYGADWRNFVAAIARARMTATNQGMDAEGLFGAATEKTGGRPREDFHLTRYAAYLVAMNGDPRKEEVAAAQSYFAIRTREAEVAQPRELTDAELMSRALMVAQRTIREAEERAELASARALELEPKASAWDTFLSSTGDVSVNEAAKALSRNSGHVLGERKLRRLLEEHRWIYRDHKKHPRAYQAKIDSGRLAERAQAYRDQETGEWVQVTPQVRVTAKGLDAIRDLLSRLDR